MKCRECGYNWDYSHENCYWVEKDICRRCAEKKMSECAYCQRIDGSCEYCVRNAANEGKMISDLKDCFLIEEICENY